MRHYDLDFIVDIETLALMDALKLDFNCAGKGYANLLRKSLGLAKAAVEAGEGSDGVVLIYPQGKEDQAIALDLRH